MEILKALEKEIVQTGEVKIFFNTAFNGLQDDHQAQTTQSIIKFEKLINAAGAHADAIAHRFGLAKEYRILPFKGTYKKLTQGRNSLVRGNIYPVPDLRTPFLGVHLTRTADGEALVGPTAIPAFGRENYGFFEKLGGETFNILYRDAILLLKNKAFRQTAFTEPRKYFTRVVFNEARKLVPELKMQDFTQADLVGMRPQLVNWQTKTLVMDFMVLRHGDTIHILNPISPAFTSSLAFASDIADNLLG